MEKSYSPWYWGSEDGQIPKSFSFGGRSRRGAFDVLFDNPQVLQRRRQRMDGKKQLNLSGTAKKTEKSANGEDETRADHISPCKVHLFPKSFAARQVVLI